MAAWCSSVAHCIIQAEDACTIHILATVLPNAFTLSPHPRSPPLFHRSSLVPQGCSCDCSPPASATRCPAVRPLRSRPAGAARSWLPSTRPRSIVRPLRLLPSPAQMRRRPGRREMCFFVARSARSSLRVLPPVDRRSPTFIPLTVCPLHLSPTLHRYRHHRHSSSFYPTGSITSRFAAAIACDSITSDALHHKPLTLPPSAGAPAPSVPLVPRPSYSSPTPTPPFPSFSSSAPLFSVPAFMRAARV